MKTNKLWKTVSDKSLVAVRGGNGSVPNTQSAQNRLNNTNTFYISIGVNDDGGTGAKPTAGGPIGPPVGDGRVAH